ncbi:MULTISPECIES: exonuclease domain-containing protein [unclassified Streptomyces]|uniref:exonuclease domain-containing protein n=1 Tax=unclassified Streptomyces TaxID=2593676 RepID=UPI000376E4F2|nr:MULTISPECIES: exonuclease domain-containing protein [unclassified Streptomyces]
MSWHEGILVGLDFETSGTDPETDRIVTASVVYWQNGQTLDSRSWLSDAGGVEIPAGATAVHGISTRVARSAGRPAAEVVAEVKIPLAEAVERGLPIVAMNASFDLTMLEAEAVRYGQRGLFSVSVPYVLDPRVLDKHTDPWRPGRRTLTDLCGHYRVPLLDAHSAHADAEAACAVVWEIAARHDWLTDLSLESLHEDQARWAREQAVDLREYFARTPGREHLAAGVREDWPIVPLWPVGLGERV